MATLVDPIEALRGVGRSTIRTGSLPRKILVVFQAALSLVVLSASGLLTTALHRLENQNLGFDQDRRIVANVNPRLAGYRPEQLTPLYRRIHDSLSSLPGASALALCIPIIKGRGISEQDTAASRHVAVVNEAFARKFFKNKNPIGKHFGRSEMGASRQYEIIGIAKDARY